MEAKTNDVIKEWRETRNELRRALSALDETNAPAQIGAYVDLALCHLEAAIESSDAKSV